MSFLSGSGRIVSLNSLKMFEKASLININEQKWIVFFLIEWNLIILTIFLLIMNQTEFRLVHNLKKIVRTITFL